jgi:hypothetical protein
MASNTRTTLEGLYKTVYPKGMENPIPDQTPLQGEIAFKQSAKVGEKFVQSVVLTLPGGFTYNGGTARAGTAYTLLGAVPAQTDKAEIVGSEITMQEQISYGAAKAAMGGPESFKDAVGFMFEGMNLSARRRLEIDLLYGQRALGITGTLVDTSAMPITDATWAPGIWVGTKGHYVNVMQGGDTKTAMRDVGTGTTYHTDITKVDFANKRVYVTAYAAVATTDGVYWRGANKEASDWSTNSCLGIAAATKIVAASLWGIDNTTYELWRPSYRSAGSQDLSFDILGLSMQDLFQVGATGKFTAWVSPRTWINLISPEVAVRNHDQSYKPEKVTVGHDAIEFRHLTGVLTVKAHPMIMEGECYILNTDLWDRIGSTDITFEQDVGSGSKRIFLHLATSNGFEVRLYSDQAPFTRRPCWSAQIYGIVNS